MDNNNISANQNIAIQMARYFATKTGLWCIDRTFAVLDTLGDNLNMYLVHADGNKYECLRQQQVPLLGILPIIRVISEKMVNSVNMNVHLIPSGDTQAMQSEYAHHYPKAERVLEYISRNPGKETLKLATSFAANKQQKYIVALPVPEAKASAASHARKYVQHFSDFLQAAGVRFMDLEKVLLLGDTLSDDDVRSGLMALGESKLVSYPGDPTSLISTLPPVPADDPLSAGAPLPDDEATQFQMEEAESPEPQPAMVSQYRDLPQVDISSLQSGTWIKIETFDPTPGKGAAYQEFECLGDGLLKVVSSGRSLMPGDVARPFDSAWNLERQVDLEITRGAKSLGRFRTRVVKRIMVKNFYE